MRRVSLFLILSIVVAISCKKNGEDFVRPDCEIKSYNLKVIPYDSLHLVTGTPVPLDESYPCDPEGVPLFLNPYDGRYYYHPVNIAIKGMQYLNSYVLTGDSRYLLRVQTWVDKLLDISYEIDGALYFPYHFNCRPHGSNVDTLFAPWFSGMAQGQVLELIVRLYNVTHNSRYLNFADKIFQSFKNLNRENYPWVAFIESDRYYWIEEYPMEEPGYVLNGCIHALQGIYEYWLLTKDPEVKVYIEATLTTLQDKLPLFRNPGGISYYCLKHHHQDPVYHLYHIYLVNYLYRMTGEQFFKDFADSLYSDYH
jgi:hypothetical protein